MSNRKRYVFLALLLVSMFMLVGAGNKLLELRDDNKLIDLEKAVENAKIGNEGNSDTEKNVPKVTPTTTVVPSKTFTVIIENTDIRCNGITCSDINSLEYKLKDCTSRDKVVLSGDFAEAHVYHEVEKLLDTYAKNNKITIEKEPIE